MGFVGRHEVTRVTTGTEDSQFILKTLHAQLEENHRTIRSQREELSALRARLDTLADREDTLRDVVLQRQDQLLQSQAEAQALREQLAFVTSTRAWRLGEAYVRNRDRLRAAVRVFRLRQLGARETLVDLGIVAALLAPLLLVPTAILRVWKAAARRSRGLERSRR
jgi:hypothetical protein